MQDELQDMKTWHDSGVFQESCRCAQKAQEGSVIPVPESEDYLSLIGLLLTSSILPTSLL